MSRLLIAAALLATVQSASAGFDLCADPRFEPVCEIIITSCHEQAMMFREMYQIYKASGKASTMRDPGRLGIRCESLSCDPGAEQFSLGHDRRHRHAALIFPPGEFYYLVQFIGQAYSAGHRTRSHAFPQLRNPYTHLRSGHHPRRSHPQRIIVPVTAFGTDGSVGSARTI